MVSAKQGGRANAGEQPVRLAQFAGGFQVIIEWVIARAGCARQV